MKRFSFPLVLFLALGVGGCARRPVAPLAAPAPKTQSGFQPKQAVRAVADYLGALEKDDYAAAYNLLTAESKRKRTLDEFESEAKQGGIIYDVEKAQAQELPNARAKVSMPLLEDPAVKSFTLAREQGHWRIAYSTGRPWAPYP